MKELYEGAINRGMQLYPVSNCRALAESPQLKDRGFWEEIDHPELGTTITYPGAWVKMSEARCNIRRRAPLIGEHNQEIYKGELGLSDEELSILKQAGVI
jgi:crotonobetainyl-CoA:carnitine CoA-transferase CaiB-like acyl-CoA transferase